jgi:hypothetical protein
MLICWPNEALTLRASAAKLGKPSQRILDTHRVRLNGSAIADLLVYSWPLIYGSASKFLDGKHNLVALQKHSNQDHLSRTLRNHYSLTTFAEHGTR